MLSVHRCLLNLKVSSIDCIGTNRKPHSQSSAIESLALYKRRELEYSTHHHHVFTLGKDSKTAQIYKKIFSGKKRKELVQLAQ